MMHQAIKTLLERVLGVEIILEHPKDRDLGHYASVVAFSLAKSYKKSPQTHRPRVGRTARTKCGVPEGLCTHRSLEWLH
ncbi:hypothetical protein HBZS_109970 [Helicobacter bizzozeronii CCUG 35545]|nr:hypothetical protein HBZS_109970 [Helicobacter bizzozeronii CCUG 35545]